MATSKKKKNKGGRPVFQFDWDKVDELLEHHCTQAEIAAYFGVGADTLRDAVPREKGLSYADYAEWRKAGGKAKLRSLQFRMAHGGSEKLTVHLGKHVLNQTDKTRVEQVNTNVEIDLSNFSDEELDLLEALKRKAEGDAESS